MDPSPWPLLPHAPEHLVTTHWSVVLQAGDSRSPERSEAMEKLCRAYWRPLYAYVRRRGFREEEAKDLTQGFFARLLEKNYVGDANASRGRFRTFLLTSLNHFLANEWDRSQAAKRGGGAEIFSIDELDGEDLVVRELSSTLTPERIFEQRWAESVLESVLAQLRREFDDAARGLRFDELKSTLLKDGDALSYAALAARLGLSESGARSVVHRLRKRFRDLTLLEIGQTVEDPRAIDDELRHLLNVLAD